MLFRNTKKQLENTTLLNRKVLILCPYPYNTAPGQRFRYEQYLNYFREVGIKVELRAFLDEFTWNILYKPGYTLKKLSGVLKGFIKRLLLIPAVFKYDYIFLFREAAPVGPPIIEFILFALRRRVIYDFDDAIFIPTTSKVNRMSAFLKWSSKVAYITKNSCKVSVCNTFLVEWVKQYNNQAVLIPTTIDPEYHKPSGRVRGLSLPVVGWTGTHSTAKYLELVRPVLKRLQEKYEFEFRVICDTDPGFQELNNYRFIKWQLATEIEDLDAIDIGLMPVPEGSWENGKVGFKAIQYSALEIVPVVSSVGSGHEVVKHGETGIVVNNTESEWYEAIERLLCAKDTWDKMGKRAREYILDHYSVPSQVKAYLSLFE